MAAGRKEYELLFKLKAALNGNFHSSFSDAISTTRQLQNTMTKINSVTKKIDGYQRQTTAVENNRKKLAELTTEHDRLQQEIRQTEQPSKALQKQYERNEKQIAATTAKIEEQQKKLNALASDLKQAGVNTQNLSASNEKLQKSYENVKKSQEELAGIIAEQEKTADTIASTKAQLAKTIGVVGAVGAAIYAGPVQSAVKFESKMADVVKVVDGLKDGTGELTQEYFQMKKEFLDLSTKIPMTGEQLTEIAAAAGQAGIAREEIIKFSEDAGKMGIAFDTTAEQAGEWMAKWRTSFGLSQEQVVELSDKINYLGNTSAANAAQISSIVMKVGPLGEVAGFANGEIAALGATLVSVGVSEDVAATGIKKVMTTMTAGAAATKRQQAVLDTMGISATDLAQRMQKDAKGAVLDFMGAIHKLPKAEQTATLKNYFGEESVSAIAPMLTKLDLLKEQFEKVGDASQYAGSMEAEYASRADTTENKIQLAKNSLTKLSVTLGETFLPYMGQAAEKVSELVTQFAGFVEKNPQAIKDFMKLAAKLVALKVGGQAANLGFLKAKQGILGVQKIIKLFCLDTSKTGSIVTKNVGGMTKSIGLLKGAFTLLSGPIGITITALAALTGGIMLYMKSQENARQDTLTFSKDLKKAAESYQEVSNKAASTQNLIDEYRQLEEKTRDVATSADEAAQAKERMKNIEELLIEQNPNVLSKYDQENGKISENLGLLEKKTQQELELAKIQLEQQQYEAEKKLPKALGEIGGITAKTKSLLEQYETEKKVRDELGEIIGDWQIFNATQHSNEEINQMFDQLTQKAEQVGKLVGKDWTFQGNGFAGIESTYINFEKKVSKSAKNITKSKEELTTVTQSVNDYYDASLKLAEIDLGGSFITVSENLSKIKSELAELQKNGQGDGTQADKLKTKIKELEPKLLTAAATIRDLNLAVKEVPDVKTINVNNAVKDIEGFIKKLNEVPTSKKIKLIVQQSSGKIPGYATGGIITKPTLATFAEKSPEAAIPIDGSQRSKAIWLHTGKLLHMQTPQTAATYAPMSNVTAPAVAVGGQTSKSIVINSTPKIYVDGNRPNDLDEKLKNYSQELLYTIENRLRKNTENERRGWYA
ncbi:TP901 family phage tail tape measure protein [Hydrogenoanaerobacterium saccharovorans]|uniref:Phage tail tape measure protein, TP901 family, core region n=1 Tax=Hydrogenoanaerobacterium saccharovorans TaxID=474960 RepID=A0A1H8A1R0_9FIRM|nr:phage tail tape measure protein [Hydrogenoanaerobacterium saccharovorans]RPF48262.1 TP901 family phage tail tape measure protein [Hydrogenoanaerobacterium saccharovorans]SEM63844.1 phage tail tape measure protein, TP901 family, core region [Hydrogenoanaerobacterium saccharovorans]